MPKKIKKDKVKKPKVILPKDKKPKDKKKKTKKKKTKKLKSKGNLAEPFLAKGGGAGASIAQQFHQPYPASVRDANIVNGLKVADSSAAVNLLQNRLNEDLNKAQIKLNDDLNKKLVLVDKKIEDNRFDESKLVGYDQKYDRMGQDIEMMNENSKNRDQYVSNFEKQLKLNKDNLDRFNDNSINVISDIYTQFGNIERRNLQNSTQQAIKEESDIQKEIDKRERKKIEREYQLEQKNGS